ncbi:DUF2637 domain-containing protein [Micromonospora sp. CPCC 205556]|uniref:DUF2637 domain-containing protein n=1 Tax=Micromonospora sp. CPCC 205556 TaxID=3122398 RepID=UPI002FEE957A
MSTTAAVANVEVGERDLSQLRRLRWAVRGVLTLGVAASVAANVLHARPNPVSQIISAWPPLALMLTVELISRVPSHQRVLAVVRLLAAASIAGIAAWVSYWHMAGVAARYGETKTAAYLLPISVDGLVIVASVSLVEITARIRCATSHRPRPTTRPEPGPSVTSPDTPASHSATTRTLASFTHRPEADSHPAATPAATARTTKPVTGSIMASAPEMVAGLAAEAGKQRRTESALPSDPAQAADAPHETKGSEGLPATQTSPSDPHDRHEKNSRQAPARTGNVSLRVPAQDRRRRTQVSHGMPNDDTTGGEVPSTTPAAVAYWYRRDPNLHPAEIATRIGRSERTVRRHWPPPTDTASPPVNGPRHRQVADGLHR